MMSRKAVRGVSAWVFGFASTIFLIAMWGRAVVIDVDSLSEAAAPLSDSSLVVGLFTDWLDAELAAADVDPETSLLVRQDILSRSSVATAMGEFAGELVTAAATPDPEGTSVDVAGLLRPAVPDITSALVSAGIPVPESQVASVVSGIDPLVVRGPGTVPYLGPASHTASRLGTAAVLSLVVMVVAGWAAVASAEDRIAETRGLLSRVALGSLSFSILLKAGSWVLDPRGGRAPFAESAALVADAKWLVPLGIALATGAAAGAIWGVRRYLRRGAGSPMPDESPKRRASGQLIRSGGR